MERARERESERRESARDSETRRFPLWPVSRPSHPRRPQVFSNVARRHLAGRPSVGVTARSGYLRRTAGGAKTGEGRSSAPPRDPRSTLHIPRNVRTLISASLVRNWANSCGSSQLRIVGICASWEKRGIFARFRCAIGKKREKKRRSRIQDSVFRESAAEPGTGRGDFQHPSGIKCMRDWTVDVRIVEYPAKALLFHSRNPRNPRLKFQFRSGIGDA